MSILNKNMLQLLYKSKNNKILFKLTDHAGTYYFKDKKFAIRHRDDGPALEYYNGDNYWLINDQQHRSNGPARKQVNTKSYFLNDRDHDKPKYLSIAL